MSGDEKYMARAVQIAWGGLGNVSPNPMVGAVIVCDGRIIGEGYHRRYGGPHAEVNAIASVTQSDRELLKRSTMYVTLEPCSHFGKTPPCADLIISTGIPRVVVGCLDPFEKVSGRGIARLRDAGVDVTAGVLKDLCEEQNKVFLTAHRLRRPFVTLKWAQSRDGFMARLKDDKPEAVKFSTDASTALVHAMRARHDAIMVGSSTAIIDMPRLSVRDFTGREPVKIVLDRRGRCDNSALQNLAGETLLYLSAAELPAGCAGEPIAVSPRCSLSEVLSMLYSRGITSLLVEGGAQLLRGFMDEGLWDEARVEIASMCLENEGTAQISMPGKPPVECMETGGNVIICVKNRNNRG
ncbi:MAG: bifunctional diaminohydroxyphosphoribosylaminopyrimidine deaminase/5-amino-6-(5-phosphoribosylamino)uracil reductase RibD [Paramuribaculum sp.]|nr:bifunctional diaminohydroxyphosphoribosylaminopyrimidine deaminase/5-amino-6-(5-phosphoribosylamino)uracil reductase RibD [Paramuribaculum sp.]